MKRKVFLGVLSATTFLIVIFSIAQTILTSKISPELNLSSYSSLGKNFGQVVAASCGFSTAGHKDEDYTTCYDAVYTCPNGSTVLNKGHSRCGGTCQAFAATATPVPCDSGESCIMKCPTGYNVASTETLYIGPEPTTIPTSCTLQNPPNCSMCTDAITPTVSYSGFQLTVNNIYMYTNVSGKPTPQYSLGTCASGVPSGYKRVCEINRISSDGTNTGTWTEDYDSNKTTWTNQLAKTYPYSENIQIRCAYQNIASSTYSTWSAWYRADAATIHPNYGLPCENFNGCGQSATSTYDVFGVCPAVPPAVASCSATNACGQTYSGSICNSVCNAGGGPDNINNSCINDFQFTTDRVSPNGSVEFSWNANSASATPKCSFVDLTSPVPRPIPGLQDLSPTTDRVRITNIQVSTRFCLVCKFYDALNPTSLLGEAVKHQWIRVQRIGEN
jgi:hypothetical protein